MKKINLLFGLIFSMCVATVGFSGFAFADDFSEIYGTSDPYISASENDACNLPEAAGNPACKSGGNSFETARNIINTVLAIMGIVAVIVVIVAGVTMTTSAGDSTKVKKAKNAIIYAIIGLAVTIGASLIVNFVLTSVF